MQQVPANPPPEHEWPFHPYDYPSLENHEVIYEIPDHLVDVESDAENIENEEYERDERYVDTYDSQGGFPA